MSGSSGKRFEFPAVEAPRLEVIRSVRTPIRGVTGGRSYWELQAVKWRSLAIAALALAAMATAIAGCEAFR